MKWKRLLSRAFPYLMVAPAVIFFTLFVVYPFLKSVYISFFDWNGLGEMTFVGFKNYLATLQDANYWHAFGNTFKWIVVTTLGLNICGLTLAYIIYKQVFLKGFFRTVAYLPVTLSMVVCGLLWMWIFNPTFGLLNSLLRAVHLDSIIVGWLGDPKVALYSVMWVNNWQWVGFHMVLYLAGIQAIPRDLYEAAALDGANGVQRFVHVTIPQLNSTIVTNVLMCITGGFIYNYEAVQIMTGGGPGDATEVALTYIAKNAFQFYKYGYSSAMTVVLVVITFLFGFLQVNVMTKDENYV